MTPKAQQRPRQSILAAGWLAIPLLALVAAAPVSAQVPGACLGGPIASGQTVSAEIWGNECRFTFNGSAGDRVTIDLVGLAAGLDPVLKLLDPGGAVEVFDDDGGSGASSRIADHPLRSSGEYVIVAGAYAGEGGFRLSLKTRQNSAAAPQALAQPMRMQRLEVLRQETGARPATPPVAVIRGIDRVRRGVIDDPARVHPSGLSPTPAGPAPPVLPVCTAAVIAAGSPISAGLEADEACEYSFTGRAGDEVKISLTRLAGDYRPWLGLVAPDGRLEASSAVADAHGAVSIRDHMLPSSGTYRLLVASPDEPPAGDFRLSLLFTERRPAALPAGCGGTLGTSEPTTLFERIASPGDSCSYSLQLPGFQTVFVTMTHLDGELDPWVEVVDPGGKTTLGTAGGGESHVEIPHAGAGTYVVRARSFADRGSGVFRLSIDPVKMTQISLPTCGEEILISGQTVSAGLDKACPYYFDGRAGDLVTLRLNALTAGLDPVLVLSAPGGQEEAYDDDGGGGGNSLIEGHRLLATGRYKVVASAYGASEGDFSLSLQIGPGGL